MLQVCPADRARASAHQGAKPIGTFGEKSRENLVLILPEVGGGTLDVRLRLTETVEPRRTTPDAARIGVTVRPSA
jgi:hypothetical protein